MSDLNEILEPLKSVEDWDNVTIEIPKAKLQECCLQLRDDPDFEFKQIIDIAGVDYLLYGRAEWKTDESTSTGFDRAADRSFNVEDMKWEKPRFAAVYHLLSLSKNRRLRLKVFLEENDLIVDSVTNIWSGADWFEREAFDMFGILFEGHPDLRRILTDYGFIGHPFRKDFPISGHVEMRYDEKTQRVVYEPVEIQERVLVPKVIRHDNRYEHEVKNG